MSVRLTWFIYCRQLVGQNIDTYEKIGVQVPWSKRMCWHTFFAGYQTTRIAIMVVQVRSKILNEKID